MAKHRDRRICVRLTDDEYFYALALSKFRHKGWKEHPTISSYIVALLREEIKEYGCLCNTSGKESHDQQRTKRR